ncbi:MAG: hypothetical protein QCI38_04600, partial [Candidatus Thermoplasmatota archaeon]|nr:hypothetical protein [Candidatus Thermoplasmatota archaeon]
MPTSKIGENISRKAGVVIIVILAVTAFFGYSMSQIEFGIEEDSFNPQTDIYQTLQEVNQAFGSEGSMTQVVVRSIDGSNILSRDAMLEILEFQIELENNEKVKATLANGGEGAVSGPPDMVYAILLMLNGTEMIGANLLLANSSMTPGQFQFAELLAQNINAQVDSLVLIMDSTDPAVTANIRQAALDLYSLTPSLAAMASEESTEGDTPSSNPLFDNLAVVSSTPTMPGLKGNATDILVRQFELVEMMADSTGGSGGVDPLSTLMPVLLEPGQSRENRTFALGGTLAMMDMTYEILQGPFNSAISMTQLSGGILAYAMAGDWDNVTLYNSMLGASAGANSTRLMTETMMLDSLNNSMASLLFHINSTSGSTDVLGAVNHTMENTTTVLSFSAAYPTLHQQMAEYNQTLGFIKMQIMMGEYGNLSVLAQMTGGLIPSVMTAMGNTYVAGSSFSQIASDSMVLGTANNTLDNITAASNLFNRCNETAGSFGGMTFMISIFRPIVQNLYDIYNSVAPEPFVEAATSFFAMLGGETEGDDAENLQMDPAILSPLKDAIAGYRDIQWSGAGASITGAGDYLLLSQMMPLSFPDMPGGDGGANGLPGENGDEEIPLRAQQRQWLENITDQEIRHGLLQASEYQNHELRDLGNWTYLTYVSSASEALGAGQNVSAASERLMSIMQEYNSTTEYGWTNATSIAHYAQTMGGVGVMLEETGGQLSGMARLFLRLPDLGDQLGQITSQFPALLSKDFSYSTGTAQGGMIIIRQSAE